MVHDGLVEARVEAPVDGFAEGRDARARGVGAVLQVVGDRAAARRRVLGGEDLGAGGVAAGPLVRRQRAVGVPHRRVVAAAVGVDEQLRQVRAFGVVRPRRARGASGVRGEGVGERVLVGARALGDDGEQRRVAAAQQDGHEFAVGGVGVVQLAEGDDGAFGVGEAGPVPGEFGDAVGDAQGARRRVEAGALLGVGQVGERLRGAGHERGEVGGDGGDLGGVGGHRARVAGEQFGHDAAQQGSGSGERPAPSAVAVHLQVRARAFGQAAGLGRAVGEEDPAVVGR
ncbi:hypothetical protein RB200_24025 [Streptomyces sp. PmtG]